MDTKVELYVLCADRSGRSVNSLRAGHGLLWWCINSIRRSSSLRLLLTSFARQGVMNPDLLRHRYIYTILFWPSKTIFLSIFDWLKFLQFVIMNYFYEVEIFFSSSIKSTRWDKNKTCHENSIPHSFSI